MVIMLSAELLAKIPLVIMTSDDTHARTAELLESNSCFGMEPSQVKLLKQVLFLLLTFNLFFIERFVYLFLVFSKCDTNKFYRKKWLV